MSVVIDSLCSGCSKGDCSTHQEKLVVKDQRTGLEIEARCVCKRHGAGAVVSENERTH